MVLEKLTAIGVILFGIFLYVVGSILNIDSLLYDCAAGVDVITGVVLLDGMSRGWLL